MWLSCEQKGTFNLGDLLLEARSVGGIDSFRSKTTCTGCYKMAGPSSATCLTERPSDVKRK